MRPWSVLRFVSTPIIHDNKLYIGVGQDPEHKKGVGWLWCIDITKKPATKDRPGINPFTKQPIVIKGKPAQKKVRATALKALKG